MTGPFRSVAAFLRGELPAVSPGLVPLLVLCSAAYGATMASFGGLWGDRLPMVLYGAAKVPMLFLVTMLLAVPSFYLANVLLGVGEDFREVWRGLLDYQLAVSVQLGSLIPATILVNLSTDDYRLAQAWSTVLFASAAWSGRLVLRRRYSSLVLRNPVHRPLARLWFVVYTFVGIQMGWDLRPFVGNPELAVEFFRPEIGNAYLEVGRVLVEAVGG